MRLFYVSLYHSFFGFIPNFFVPISLIIPPPVNDEEQLIIKQEIEICTRPFLNMTSPIFLHWKKFKDLFNFVWEFKWKKVIVIHESQKTPSTSLSNFLTPDHWVLSGPLQIQNNRIPFINVYPSTRQGTDRVPNDRHLWSFFFIHSKRKGI